MVESLISPKTYPTTKLIKNLENRFTRDSLASQVCRYWQTPLRARINTEFLDNERNPITGHGAPQATVEDSHHERQENQSLFCLWQMSVLTILLTLKEAILTLDQLRGFSGSFSAQVGIGSSPPVLESDITPEELGFSSLAVPKCILDVLMCSQGGGWWLSVKLLDCAVSNFRFS